MGNKTVTPLATNNNPNTFDFAYNSENSRVHSKSPTPNMSNDPLISTPVTNLDTSAPLIKSPIPSTATIPRTSVSHVPTKPRTPSIPNSPVHISLPVTNLDTFTHPPQFDNTVKHTSFYVLNTQASPAPTESHAPSLCSPVTNLDTFTHPPQFDNTVKRTSVYVLNTQTSPVPTEPRAPSISSPVTNLDTFTHPPQFDNTVKHTSFFVLNTQTSPVPKEPHATSISSPVTNLDTLTPPPYTNTVIRTSVYVLNTQTSPVPTEPHAPNISAPVTNLDTFTPPQYTNIVKRTSVYVLNTQASRVSMRPSTPIISTPGKTLETSPINSPIPTISGNSITSTSPTNIHNNTAPQKSPMAPNTLISTVPTTLTTVDNSVIRKIPVTSPVPSIDNIYIGPYNSSPILSPDTSAVSPTFDTPPSPIPPTITVNPVKSNDTETISKTPFPYNVNAKRTPSNISLSSSAPISEQVKSSNLSSVRRWNKIQQRQKEHSHTISQTPNLVTSPSSSSSRTNTNDISKETSAILKIIPVPSFSLRSTAVCSFSIDEHLLSERTQSIHKDISIFKYYLTQKEIKRTLGNHTNATMFQMNTQLKQTPLPNPSLSFLHKNFNDGIHETDDNSSVTATFSSLGLQNDLETESVDPSTTELHSNEKQQQKNSFPVVSSNNSTSEKPLVSILKKPIHPPIEKPIPTQIDKKNDFENYSTVSFNFQTTPKANESISRSEKLFSS
ncbi:unnamed protein product [Adineta steineri]|uniref:Uncharacterized protein n=1 Tax=Adineta steineri TaxID=433720 RepID=A0A813S741_9BILA|nr:unnamed protein product [Adineta steineri]CAF1206178.1 unnamed protein product [Adineta steineri]